MVSLAKLPTDWDDTDIHQYLNPGSVGFVKFLAKKQFSNYEPCELEFFENRLLQWLNNVDNPKDKKLLLALLLEVFFVGKNEFDSLYRYLFNGEIKRWIIDTQSISLLTKNYNSQIMKAMNKTWYCPLTDSLRINSFLKVTGMKGVKIRPDWVSLLELGDEQKIRDFVSLNKIEHLVLMEDFVGSGTQIKNAVKFAARILPDCHILAAPLIICPKGDQVLKGIAKKHPNVAYRPALTIKKSSMFPSEKDCTGKKKHVDARELFERISNRFPITKDTGMLGFKHTGAQVVLYSNCPNNTLPIFHHEGKDWAPLFPRVSRIG